MPPDSHRDQFLIFNLIKTPGSSSGRTNKNFSTIGNTCTPAVIVKDSSKPSTTITTEPGEKNDFSVQPD